MSRLTRGDVIQVLSMKHGNHFHRFWTESIVLQSGDPLIIANKDVVVLESGERELIFPNLSICYFSKRDWFNIVLIFDQQDRLEQYYCNMASPYQLDIQRRVISYIDYDLDLIIDPRFNYRWVDEDEFIKNQQMYHYPISIIEEVNKARLQLEQRVRLQEEPFTPTFATEWYHQYLSLKK
ncbi:DUF402 domain-containing protein [Hazenella coriacea]|nr:DUF402 domain-containing protein [Hazenella coriacea]